MDHFNQNNQYNSNSGLPNNSIDNDNVKSSEQINHDNNQVNNSVVNNVNNNIIENRTQSFNNINSNNNSYANNQNNYDNEEFINKKADNGNNNSMSGNKRKLLSILGVIVVIIGLFGVTYAFFNYIRTGSSNTITVGKITFNTNESSNQINLTNVIPISSSDALEDENNVGVLAIDISGDTEYGSGIEYLLTAVDVNNSVGNKEIPISVIVSYEEKTNKDIGEEDESYFSNRGGNSSIYKLLANDKISEGSKFLVGYIKPDQTGIDGTLTIRAFIDSDDIIVSDTYNEATDKVLLTTNEWNSFSGNNALSFKVKVEARAGIWVVNPSSAKVISFNSEGGSSVNSMDVTEGDIIGEFPPKPTRSGYVFKGWYTLATGGDEVTELTEVNSNMDLHAQWDKLVCLKVANESNLHTETCVTTGSKPGSCATSGYTSENPTITYGAVPTTNTLVAGYAYDCDVNNDDNYTSQNNGKFTERFYYVKTENSNGALIYNASIDETGVVDTRDRQGGSYHYDVALTYLPTTTTWSNPNLVNYSGKAARLLRYDEVPTACIADMGGCQYMMENSRFQDDNKGRAGIWLERDSSNSNNASNGIRIQTKTKIVASSMNTTDTSSGSENTTRPVIEVPLRLIEGYKPTYHVTFDTQGGSAVTGKDVVEGEQLGTLPEDSTKAHYTFAGWYTSPACTKEVTSLTVIESNRTVYAKWVEKVSYTVTFETDGGTEINPIEVDAGHSLGANMPAHPVKEHHDFMGWFNQGFTQEYDENTVINSNITFYAKWQLKTVNTHYVSFETDDGTEINPIEVDEGGTLGTDMPANPTKTNYIFDGWYNQDFTVEYDKNTVINNAMTFYAKWMPNTTVAKMNGQYYTTLQAAVNAAPTSTKTTILMVQNVEITGTIDITSTTSNTGKNLVLDLGGHTISYPVSSSTKKNVIKTASIIEIKNGTIDSSSGSGLVEITTNGKLIMNSGTINATGGRQAVYNEGGTVEIGGTAQFTSSASGAYNGVDRATVQNNSGSLTITGGTITNTSGAAVSIGTGTLIIGTEDNVFNSSSPILQGNTYGVSSASASFSFYDGILKGVTNSTNADIDTKITSESGATKVIGTEGNYKTLVYELQQAQSVYTINLDAKGGTVNPNSVQVVVGDTINSSTLPTPTWGSKTFGGWYIDEDYTNAVPSTITTLVPGSTTIYAKWTYTPASQLATFDVTNDAMTTYYNNISSWVNLSESDFMSAMSTNFNNNNCSACEGANACNSPGAGTYCDKPKTYNTGVNAAVNVYLYDETTHVIGKKIEYANASSGTISNLIPGQAYYWEKASDPSINGHVQVTTPRRNVDAGNIRNVRDLGGLSVSYTENNVVKTGTLKYGKLFRGARLTSSNDDITSLSNLGVTREIDLRANSESSGQVWFPTHDNGSSGSDIIITNYLINPTATSFISTAHLSDYRNLKAAMKTVMRYVVAGDNIFFHCTIGTDRTGTIAYFLEGLLGVGEEDRLEDYELTYFYGMTNRTRYHDYLSGSSINPRFTSMYKSYPTYQDIYDFYKFEPESDDDTLLAEFRQAMIDFNS